jgi:hypothetical protein
MPRRGLRPAWALASLASMTSLTSITWALPLVFTLSACTTAATEAASPASAASPGAAAASQGGAQTEVAVLRQAVVDLYTRLYQLTPQDRRPQLLQSMLNDPVVEARLLGLDLVRQRVLDLGPDQIDPPLRQALRLRIDDADVRVQRGAVLLMRDLADPQAAEIVAQRLADADAATPVALIEAGLLMVARVPQAQAVEPAMRFLTHATVGGEAAWALSSALEVGLVSAEERGHIQGVLRRQLRNARDPHPRMVRLYGQVAADRDWARIERWLDSEDAVLREAAARTWSDSARSLGPLIDRASDPMIEPFFLAAAARRGQRAEVFLSVVDHVPAVSAADIWADALVQMAGRVDAAAVLAADRELRRREVDAALRLRVLGAAIERFDVPAVSDGQLAGPMPEDANAGRLLLARAAARQSMGDAASARADFQRAAVFWEALDEQERLACERGLVRAMLEAEELDAALQAVGASLARAGREDAPAAWGRFVAVAEVVLAAARQRTEAGQHDASAHLLDGLSRTLDRADARFDGLGDLRQRIARLRDQPLEKAPVER